MYLLAFDTETSGFPKDLPSDHPDQVRLVELGALLVRIDPREPSDMSTLAAEVSLVVDPEDREIPTGASDVHGITTDIAREVGVPLKAVLRVFHALAKRADFMLAYNVSFDRKVLTHAFGQAYPGTEVPWPRIELDVMPVLTPICKLPPTAKQRRYYPGKRYKTPKLEEAYRHAFEEPMQCAHSAIADVRATLELLGWCLEHGHMNRVPFEVDADIED